MTVWFSNSVPVKGVCIDSYRINEFGDILDENTFSDARVKHSKDFTSSRVEPHKSLPVDGSFRRSPTGSIDSRTTDPRMVSQLHVLVKDAQSVFEEILTRNANLEQEVNELRNQSFCDSSTVQSSSKRPSSTPGMLTRRNLENFSAFNISTPPKDFIDLSQPVRIHSRR